MPNGALAVLLIIIGIAWALNVVRYLSQIGKPREPIQATVAAWDALINAGIIAVIVMAAVRLR